MKQTSVRTHLHIHYPIYSSYPRGPFAYSSPGPVAGTVDTPLWISFRVSVHLLFHGVGQTSFLFSAGEIASVLLAKWGWKMFEVKIRKVLLVSSFFVSGGFPICSFCFVIPWRLSTEVTIQFCSSLFVRGPLTWLPSGKLPHWINKSCCVHILTSYPLHGHGTPCFSFRLIHTVSFVFSLRNLQRRRLNI